MDIGGVRLDNGGGKGWIYEKGGVWTLVGEGGIPVPWNVFEALMRYT